MSPALLLVDDEEASTQILGMILEGEGFKVDTALTGAETLRKIKEKQFDLILLDFKLPDFNGDDLAADIQEMCPKIKIILLSGLTVNDMLSRGVNYAAVLLKPISPDDIIREINKALS